MARTIPTQPYHGSIVRLMDAIHQGSVDANARATFAADIISMSGAPKERERVRFSLEKLRERLGRRTREKRLSRAQQISFNAAFRKLDQQDAEDIAATEGQRALEGLRKLGQNGEASDKMSVGSDNADAGESSGSASAVSLG